jgi:hypothetical protein
MTIGGGTAQDLGRASDGVVLVGADGTQVASAKPVRLKSSKSTETDVTSTNWCIAVAAVEGSKKLYSYSAEDGITAGKNCNDTTTFTATK